MNVVDPAPSVATALEERYAVEEEIERGPLSVSYRATDRQRHRPVTLEVLHHEIVRAMAVDRFLESMAAATELDHPGILTLEAVDRVEGAVYLVWPRLRGTSLHRRLEAERPFPIDRALRIAHAVADALCYGHDYGVVHGAVTPATIVLDGDRVTVTGFGLVRSIRAAGGDAVLRRTVWRDGAEYLSPEQTIEGAVVDGRTDVYALGCVLFEMLVGEPPFTGATPDVVLEHHRLQEPAPVSTRREMVSPTVDEAVATALAKVPSERFRSASDFANVLGARRQSVILARAPADERLSSRNVVYAVAAVGALVVAALLGWLFA